jgi:hypothetical protein
MKICQCSYAVVVLLFGAISNTIVAAAAPSAGMSAPVAPARPAVIQILEIDVPAAPTRPEWILKKEKESEEQRRQISKDRAIQQEQARKRAEEAKAEAERKEGRPAMDPAVKFDRAVNLVERFLKEGKFQSARGIFDQAMKDKPADLPVSDRVQTAEAQLNAQSAPVEVRLKSDGETSVRIVGLINLQKFYSARIMILPGDYEVIGSGRNHPDVTIKLRVRNGEPPPPVISVVAK